jgi:hypothetical protein
VIVIVIAVKMMMMMMMMVMVIVTVTMMMTTGKLLFDPADPREHDYAAAAHFLLGASLPRVSAPLRRTRSQHTQARTTRSLPPVRRSPSQQGHFHTPL